MSRDTAVTVGCSVGNVGSGGVRRMGCASIPMRQKWRDHVSRNVFVSLCRAPTVGGFHVGAEVPRWQMSAVHKCLPYVL